ncbi:MAG: hypothetical protein NZ900_03595 [Synergistetes bacterium]|nr:hypothetical protein [Synergistota bacterium]MDW8192015.1 hypothetical protein [Synergistota bacterium]
MDAVNYLTLRSFSRYEVSLSFEGFSQKDRISVIYEALKGKDATLGKNFLIVVSFLRQIDPDVVEHFLNVVESSLKLEKQMSMRRNREGVDLFFEIDLRIVVAEELGDEEGNVISTRLVLEIAVGFNSNLAKPKRMDPIVLDIHGDGIRLSGLENPVYFDIDGDGFKEKVSFVEGDDAFLFLDLNMNKFLDNGWELVGDNFGFKNGFEMLKAFDIDKDNKITMKDPVYSSLYIFQDLNKNKKVETYENRSLFEAGVIEIDLLYNYTDIKLNETDKIIAISSYRTALNKEKFKVGDVILSYLR